MARSNVRLAARLVPLLLLGMFPARAYAQDNFEIQVYDSETAGPWRVGLETHLIYIVYWFNRDFAGGGSTHQPPVPPDVRATPRNWHLG